MPTEPTPHARLAPLPREALAEFEPLFLMVEKGMGFVPSSLFTMARWPELLRAFAGLAGTVNLGGTLSPELKGLVSFVASRAAGCQYCQAHTSHGVVRAGASAEKLDAAFEFETSPLFSDAERAALALAREAAQVPNAVTDDHFVALRRHFDEREITELMAVVSLFGFLNRWNDSLATPLEAEPRAFAERTLGGRGWSAGKHAGS